MLDQKISEACGLSIDGWSIWFKRISNRYIILIYCSKYFENTYTIYYTICQHFTADHCRVPRSKRESEKEGSGEDDYNYNDDDDEDE